MKGNPWDLPVPVSQHWVTGIHVIPGFYVHARDLDLDPCTCTVSTYVPQPFPQPLSNFIKKRPWGLIAELLKDLVPLGFAEMSPGR